MKRRRTSIDEKEGERIKEWEREGRGGKIDGKEGKRTE